MTKLIKDYVWYLRKNYAPEKWFIEHCYAYRFGKKPNLRNPKTFSEKIQWLKLYYRPNGMYRYVDKYEVRQYISKTIGSQFLVELIGVWDNPNEIDFNILPHAFAMKATHASATNLICSDKSKIDWEYEQDKLAHYLKYNLYSITKEWAYKYVKPRIMCEAYLDEQGQPPIDYKYFCFNGQPKIIQVDVDRFSVHKRSMMSTDWKPLPMQYYYPTPDIHPNPPSKLAEQLDLARALSEPFPFVRVDFFCVNDNTYFGELTFYPESGYKGFIPDSWDNTIGSWLDLPTKIR